MPTKKPAVAKPKPAARKKDAKGVAKATKAKSSAAGKKKSTASKATKKTAATTKRVQKPKPKPASKAGTKAAPVKKATTKPTAGKRKAAAPSKNKEEKSSEPTVTETPDILWTGDSKSTAYVLLAPSASGNKSDRSMESLAASFVETAKGKCRVGRFNFPRGFKEATLVGTWHAAIQEARKLGAKRLLIGGRSMGGRMATYAAETATVDAVACFGYPFIPMAYPNSAPKPPRVDRFDRLKTPTVILQGERDSFGGRKEIEAKGPIATALAANKKFIRLEWIKDGDHSLTPRASSGETAASNLAKATQIAWQTFERA